MKATEKRFILQALDRIAVQKPGPWSRDDRRMYERAVRILKRAPGRPQGDNRAKLAEA